MYVMAFQFRLSQLCADDSCMRGRWRTLTTDFPLFIAIPGGTAVPHWAYLNVTTTDTWDQSAAEAVVSQSSAYFFQRFPFTDHHLGRLTGIHRYEATCVNPVNGDRPHQYRDRRSSSKEHYQQLRWGRGWGRGRRFQRWRYRRRCRGRSRRSRFNRCRRHLVRHEEETCPVCASQQFQCWLPTPGQLPQVRTSTGLSWSN